MQRRFLFVALFIMAVFVGNCKSAVSEIISPKTISPSVDTDSLQLKVLQLNVWQEGTMLNGGFDAIADVIIQSKADVVTLSEVRNYNGTKFNERIISALKVKGANFYSFYDNNVSILSKFQIASFTAGMYSGNFDKIILQPSKEVRIAVYSVHIDYTHYACYLPRGYDGVTWKKLPAPITDVNAILQQNIDSKRDEAINAFVADAAEEQKKGSIIIMGGDFNEPSHLDWTEATKNLFDHNGTVVPWHNSITLQNKGYKDAYRVKYPDPVKYPGFTWAAFNANAELSKLVWAPDADERDRIDFIYYNDDKRITLQNIIVVGPSACIVRGSGFEDRTLSDPLLKPNGIWPSDHKGLLATFKITKK
ncbi:endonuclease/exonuclease/phosphatase family protein [Solitalea lacus]|uniref:endonuclease/exonuclease/phosphatase family protein n=1 Tax=Solitalea lacus TaxID=2911172 RepID=UPI001EDC6D31|nr:endonuclease/exonuclease/phosphatase family protein [Solitalea lacus]UKJ06811.1 endonuclease/exonuclease/phosphatase family protein [Solitalea lacus]